MARLHPNQHVPKLWEASGVPLQRAHHPPHRPRLSNATGKDRTTSAGKTNGSCSVISYPVVISPVQPQPRFRGSLLGTEEALSGV